jgi:hypothetical protein
VVAVVVLAGVLACTSSVTRFVYLETESRISVFKSLDVEYPDVYAGLRREVGGRITSRGGNRYWVGLTIAAEDSSQFGARQILPGLCWAAAVETLLRTVDIQVDQCDIVQRVQKRSCSDAAHRVGSYKDVVKALDLWKRGPGGWTRALAFRPTMKDLVRELAHGRPFVLGLTAPGSSVGHVYVVVGMTFRLLPDPLSEGGTISSWPAPVLADSLDLYNPLLDVHNRHFSRVPADSIEPMVTMLVPLGAGPPVREARTSANGSPRER